MFKYIYVDGMNIKFCKIHL